MLNFDELGVTREMMQQGGRVREEWSTGTIREGDIMSGDVDSHSMFFRWSDPYPRNSNIYNDVWGNASTEPIENGLRVTMHRIGPNRPSAGFDDQPPDEAIKYVLDFVPREPW